MTIVTRVVDSPASYSSSSRSSSSSSFGFECTLLCPSTSSTSPTSACSMEMAIMDMAKDKLHAVLFVEQSRAYQVENVVCLNTNTSIFVYDEETIVQVPHQEWRRKICEWCYKVVDHFRYDREVVSVALNLFDRYLGKTTQANETNSYSNSNSNSATKCKCSCPSCRRAVDSRAFQLAAMTALYLAIKLHSDNNRINIDNLDEVDYYSSVDTRTPSANTTTTITTNSSSNNNNNNASSAFEFEFCRRKKLRLSSFIDLSRGQFSMQDISTMECTMLSVLSWRVHPSTSMAIVEQLLQFLPTHAEHVIHSLSHETSRSWDLVKHVLHELSRYICELSVCLANVSCVYQPSEVAFASILISMDMLTLQALPMQARDCFCRSSAQASSGQLCVGTHKTLYSLRETLSLSFLPGVLLMEEEENNISYNDQAQSSQKQYHPVSIARDAGLLDIHYIQRNRISRQTSATSVMDSHMHDDPRVIQLQEQQKQGFSCVTP